MVASLDIVLEFTCSPATSWVGEFEWPEEVGSLRSWISIPQSQCRSVAHLLEVGTNSEDFVDQIFNRENVELAQGFFNNGIAR